MCGMHLTLDPQMPWIESVQHKESASRILMGPPFQQGAQGLGGTGISSITELTRRPFPSDKGPKIPVLEAGETVEDVDVVPTQDHSVFWRPGAQMNHR